MLQTTRLDTYLKGEKMWCTRYLYGSKEEILKFKEECHKNNIPYREDGLVVIIDKEYKQ